MGSYKEMDDFKELLRTEKGYVKSDRIYPMSRCGKICKSCYEFKKDFIGEICTDCHRLISKRKHKI